MKQLRDILSNFSWICGLHNLKLSWGAHKLCIGFVSLLYSFRRKKENLVSTISTPLALARPLC